MTRKVFIQQGVSTVETRTVRQAVMLSDEHELVHVMTEDALPVGSVEFVREQMRKIGVLEPSVDPYPHFLNDMLHREVKRCKVSDVQPGCFVKPCVVKAFTGFVYRGDDYPYDEHDTEQLRVFRSMPEICQVYVSDIVEWRSEWRYYISEIGVLLARARYDSFEEDLPSPDLEQVSLAVWRMKMNQHSNHPYCLDFGVLADGTTALVEYNDAWAIGLYEQALPPRQYLRFLEDRWRTIVG